MYSAAKISIIFVSITSQKRLPLFQHINHIYGTIIYIINIFKFSNISLGMSNVFIAF